MKNKILNSFLILFIIQLFIISLFSYNYNKFSENNNNLQREVSLSNDFMVNSFIINQQDLTTEAIRNSINYQLLKNKQKLITESNNWDTTVLERCLNASAKPYKLYGNNSGIIVFDSDTGKIFLDTTPINRVKKYPNKLIFQDYTLDECKNKTQSLKAFNLWLKNNKDSNSNSENFIYLFNESTKFTDVYDYEKYPLGQYNRIFVSKKILPSESYGFYGQDKNLTVMIFTDEQDVFNHYNSINSNINNNISLIANNMSLSLYILILSTFITMLFMFFLLLTIKTRK